MALHRTKPSATLGAAVGSSIPGKWLLSGADLTNFNHCDWRIALSAVIWAAHIVTTAKAARQLQPLNFLCLQFMVAGTLSIGATVAVEPITFEDFLRAAGSALYVGLLSSALTFAIMALARRTIAPTRAAVILSFEVGFAAIAGYLLLDERLPAIASLGAGLMFTSIFSLQLKQQR